MVELDLDWERLPVAELQQLDAVCDRFELALAENPETRIEPFVADLTGPQQRLVVRELVQLEIERRCARGQRPTPDEYALRFPIWADEIRALAAQNIAELDRAGRTSPESDTVAQNNSTAIDAKAEHPPFPQPRAGEATKLSGASWGDDWRATMPRRSWTDLPADGVLGHYQLLQVIGRGGMGIVVRAHDTKLAREVAIKIPAAEISQDAKANERFLREARSAAVIRHEHAVTIYAVEKINEIPFLVMELVDGTTLDEYLRDKGKLSADEVVALSYQMAQGLAAAHKRGLIHRDVKPANILLERDDRRDNGVRRLSTWHVKITDFGLARVAAEARLTGSGLIAGTPQYMSPEQAEGKELDARSDLFSLGSLMYAMCAGRAAFEAESAVAILRQVADKPVRPLRDLSPDTPGWLVAVIEKLMAKSPDERFQSAAEVAELLDRHAHDLQAGRSATDLDGTPPPVAVSHGRSRATVLFALTIVGIAVMLFGISRFVRAKGGRQAVDAPASPQEQAEVSPAADTGVGQIWHDWPADAPPPAIAPFDAEQANNYQIAWSNYLGVPVEHTNSIGMKFRLIPPGEFMMGSTPAEIQGILATVPAAAEHWRDYIESEGPQHRVILTQPIYLGVHEVTQANYEKVMRLNPSHFAATGDGNESVAGMETATHPVEMVSWNDAAEFCEKLSQLERLDSFYRRSGEEVAPLDGSGYRLPTEAEWEFSCRAGATTKFWNGDQDEDVVEVGWCLNNSGGRTHAAGELKASPFGLQDTHGNTWEWVQDGWVANSYVLFQEQLAINPSVRFTASPLRTVRGGFCNDSAFICRASTRAPDNPAHQLKHIGFRVSLKVGGVRQALK